MHPQEVPQYDLSDGYRLEEGKSTLQSPLGGEKMP